MKEYKIKEQVLNTVLQYLASKPYAEVYQLITELQRVEPVEEKKDEAIE